MNISIVIENENGELVHGPVVAFTDNKILDILSTCQFLKYLDPYGDLILNYLQCNDIESDLKTLENHGIVVSEIRTMVKMMEIHLYLKFLGD